MARPSIEMTRDTNDPNNIRELLSIVQSLRGNGMYTFAFNPSRETRRQRANRFHFGCVVRPLMDYYHSQGQLYNSVQTHEIIKQNTLPVIAVPNPLTGEVLANLWPDTHTMDVETFHAFETLAIHFVEGFGCVVPEPEPLEMRRASQVVTVTTRQPKQLEVTK